MSSTPTETARIIDALTPERLEAELGFTQRAIRHAKSSGLFSGLWYPELKKLCEKEGVECPLTAFYWKEAAKKSGDGVKDVQGEREGNTV
jgi:hypothetical protein